MHLKPQSVIIAAFLVVTFLTVGCGGSDTTSKPVESDNPGPVDPDAPAGPVPGDTRLFVSPIGGTAYQDWTIVNYVDLDPTGSVADWNGGNFTYDGHNAIDFTLPNFALMDAGVSVRAARDGVVTDVHDGEYDRWSRANPNTIGAPANSVVIDHGDGVVTEYLHLRMNSISVNVGDQVSAGDQIGLVGSSGNSTDAHLHFTVYENSAAIETYLNPEDWWLAPLTYSGDVSGVLDFGVTNSIPTDNDLVERPSTYNRFDVQDGAGQSVVSWAHIHGFKDGDTVEYIFSEPDDDEFAHYTWTSNQIRYGWWTARINLPENAELGTWRINGLLNGVSFLTDTFVVLDSSSAAVNSNFND